MKKSSQVLVLLTSSLMSLSGVQAAAPEPSTTSAEAATTAVTAVLAPKLATKAVAPSADTDLNSLLGEIKNISSQNLQKQLLRRLLVELYEIKSHHSTQTIDDQISKLEASITKLWNDSAIPQQAKDGLLKIYVENITSPSSAGAVAAASSANSAVAVVETGTGTQK